jgi:hypothetical protein
MGISHVFHVKVQPKSSAHLGMGRSQGHR